MTNRTAFTSYMPANRSLPVMPVRALPPYPFFTVRCHVIRRQRRIAAVVPFKRDFRIQRGQTIFRGSPMPRAVRTAVSPLISFRDRRLPFMPAGTSPPNFFPAPGKHIFRHGRQVFRRMPFDGQVGSQTGQGVPRPNFSVIAERARFFGAKNLHLIYTFFPLMAFFTAPPGFFTGVRCNFLLRAGVF